MAKSCPVCRHPTEPEFRPFCSARCREVDLGNWFLGKYAVPGEALPEEAANSDRSEDEE